MRASLAAAAASAVLLSACTGGGEGAAPAPAPAVDTVTGAAAAPAGAPATPAGPDRSVALDQAPESPREPGPSALDGLAGPGLPAPLVDPNDVKDGGPPPDGIPPIDVPRFERAGDVDWLVDDEQVLALELGGDTRAYPVRILLQHEIVNDTVGGVPVAVTYCPLCNSALAYDRRVAGRVVSFGTSGQLYFSDLVMYDRQTESLWPQIEGRAVAGVLTGTDLDGVPVQTVSWRQWREAHPEGWVLSRRTGFARDYSTNPYLGEDDRQTWPAMYWGPVDPRLPWMKQPVLGLAVGEEALAVDRDLLVRDRVLAETVGGEAVVLWWAPGARSTLDALRIGDGREVGVTGVFRPAAGGRALTFAPTADGFVDAETGSTWDVLGRAVTGPLEGERLEPVEHVSTFWFAWAAYRPETRVVR